MLKVRPETEKNIILTLAGHFDKIQVYAFQIFQNAFQFGLFMSTSFLV